MVSQVTIGDIRGFLVDADKRPVLRLLPQMDEVCRGYVIAHLGDIESIAGQVWLLNTTDWLREQNEIYGELYKTLDYMGFPRVLHEFSMKIAEDSLRSHEKQGGQVLKTSWELLKVKRRWMEGEISDKEFDDARAAYRVGDKAADRAADWDVGWAAYWAASRSAYQAAYWAAYGTADVSAYSAAYRKRQLELLADILEDAVGIKRGFEGKSLESKVSEGGL